MMTGSFFDSWSHRSFWRRSRRPCLVLLAAALACGCSSKQSDEAAGDRSAASSPAIIRVTGIPDENPTELARSYQPLVAMLERELGTKVEYVPVTDYGAAVQALIAGKVDIAWLGGFTHVQARTMGKVEPLAMRDIDREFRSVLIAHVDSGIAAAADVKGKSFAFGSKSSTSGHLMPRYFLGSQHGIDPDKDFAGPPVYSGAHDATVKMVESGRVQAGAVNIQVWERMVEDGKVDTSKVRQVFTTPPYVDYVWTARAELPAPLRDKFKDAFLALDARNPAHKPILERLGASKYVPASAADFDAIETIARTVGLLER